MKYFIYMFFLLILAFAVSSAPVQTNYTVTINPYGTASNTTAINISIFTEEKTFNTQISCDINYTKTDEIKFSRTLNESVNLSNNVNEYFTNRSKCDDEDCHDAWVKEKERYNSLTESKVTCENIYFDTRAKLNLTEIYLSQNVSAFSQCLTDKAISDANYNNCNGNMQTITQQLEDEKSKKTTYGIVGLLLGALASWFWFVGRKMAKNKVDSGSSGPSSMPEFRIKK